MTADVTDPSGVTTEVGNYLRGLQARITGAITDLDGTPFLTDAWQKPAGEKLQGRGITQAIGSHATQDRASLLHQPIEVRI